MSNLNLSLRYAFVGLLVAAASIPISRTSHADGGVSILIAAGVGAVLGAGGTWCLFKCVRDAAAAADDTSEGTEGPEAQDEPLETFVLKGDVVEIPSRSETHPFDGKYTIERGYSDLGRPSPDGACQPKYEVIGAVVASRLVFASDNRIWSGPVSLQGDFLLSEKDIIPQPRSKTRMAGSFDSSSFRAEGQLHNGYCGNGYVRITPR